MSPRSHSLAIDPGEQDASRPLASWYTEGVTDGLGDRLLMFDNSGTASLELLRFRPAIAEAHGFEDALRARVDALREFDHAAFPRIRAVDRLHGGDLALVSTFTAGKRLAEIFRSARGRAGVHPAFAAWLIRDLSGALAELQQHAAGISHGALTPERIVLTSDGRLMIVEHALGSALDRLNLTPPRLWHDLGVMAPEPAHGAAILDTRTDVIQIGWMVLSVLLGRRITPAEYPQHLDALIDEFVRTSGRRSPTMVPPIRRWLEHALRLDGDMFDSAVEANHALRELGVHTGPHAVAFMNAPAVPTTRDVLPAYVPPVDVPTPPVEQVDPLTASESRVESSIELEVVSPVEPSAQYSDPETDTMAIAADYDANIPDVELSAPTTVTTADVRATVSGRVAVGWAVAAVLAVGAIAEGVVIARLYARTPVAAPVSVPVVLESAQPGDAVLVDGRQVGVTPLEVKVAAGTRSIQVQSRPQAPAPAVVQAAAVSERPADSSAAAAIASAHDRRGGLRIASPIEIQVLEGERVLGSTADGPIVTTAGRHELDFINSALGYRSRRVVDIRAGQIVRMSVVPPDGRVSINAVPWAQVWINGSLVGDTPLANLPLAAGEHQITFRHPQLGEQTQKVAVRSAALTRVSATFAR